MFLKRDIFHESVTTPATAIAFSVETGYIPRYVRVQNATSKSSMEWFKGMADGSAIVTQDTIATASVGTIAVDEGNTGGGTSPAMAGTYTGHATGTMTLVCTKAGDCATAEMTAYMPDGNTYGPVVTGASNTAKAMAQGVTFKITNGTGDDLALGDTFTSELVAGGGTFYIPTNGITVGSVYPATITNGVLVSAGSASTTDLKNGVTVGLYTEVNVAEELLVIIAK